MFNRIARIAGRGFFSAGLGLLGVLPLSAVAADAVHGQKLYQMHCAGCHGVNGVSNMSEAPNLATTEVFNHTNQDLADVIRDGRGMMPPFLGVLKGNDFADVVGYLRTLH